MANYTFKWPPFYGFYCAVSACEAGLEQAQLNNKDEIVVKLANIIYNANMYMNLVPVI